MKRTFFNSYEDTAWPRSATILAPLWGLAASLRGLPAAAPAVNMLEEVLVAAVRLTVFAVLSDNLLSAPLPSPTSAAPLPVSDEARQSRVPGLPGPRAAGATCRSATEASLVHQLAGGAAGGHPVHRHHQPHPEQHRLHGAALHAGLQPARTGEVGLQPGLKK